MLFLSELIVLGVLGRCFNLFLPEGLFVGVRQKRYVGREGVWVEDSQGPVRLDPSDGAFASRVHVFLTLKIDKVISVS